MSRNGKAMADWKVVTQLCGGETSAQAAACGTLESGLCANQNCGLGRLGYFYSCLCFLIFLLRRVYHPRGYSGETERERERDERKLPSPPQLSTTTLVQRSQVLGPTSTRLKDFPR